MAVEASAIRGMHLQADSFNPVRIKKERGRNLLVGWLTRSLDKESFCTKQRLFSKLRSNSYPILAPNRICLGVNTVQGPFGTKEWFQNWTCYFAGLTIG